MFFGANWSYYSIPTPLSQGNFREIHLTLWPGPTYTHMYICIIKTFPSFPSTTYCLLFSVEESMVFECMTMEPDSLSVSILTSCVTLFICSGYHNKAPPTGWLQTTEMYSITVLKDRSPKSSCGQVGSFWELWGWIRSMPLSQLLMTASGTWCSWDSGPITPISAAILTWCSSRVSVFTRPSS